MNVGEAFEDTQPLLSMDDPSLVLKTLQQMDVLAESENIITIEKAGEGNMNLVMRVTTDQQSLIVKQARPWVEKYPSIAAPVERINAEIDFYDRVSAAPELARLMPAAIAARPRMRILVLEDLGRASDYSSLYGSLVMPEARDMVFEQAASWLSSLHGQHSSSNEEVGCFALRQLNHAHMFSIPFSNPPAIDLDSVCRGLEKVSQPLRDHRKLQKVVQRLGSIYLKPEGNKSVLLHGDFYPGSWLRTGEGFRVIDPEFCFFGPREFDLGIMAAHLFFCHAPPEIKTIERLTHCYGDHISMSLVLGFSGVELIRRLIGVAQLPLDADLEQRMKWLMLGEELIASFAEA